MADQISDIPKKVANAASNAAESTKKMNFAEQLSSIGNKISEKVSDIASRIKKN